MRLPGKFFDNSTRQMRVAFAGFIVAVIGVALAFTIDYRPDNPLAFVAFGIVALGVALGFSGIVWGWVDSFARFLKHLHRSQDSV